MESEEVLQAKVSELQTLDRNLQNYSIEKQNFLVELNGVNNALDELKIAKGDVYKIVGGLMVKAEKDSLTKEMEEKKKVLSLRISSIEKQEKQIEEKSSKLKKEINEHLKNTK